MAKFARVAIPGCPHHVTHRGNNRQGVFFVDDDYRVYLRLLAEEADNRGLRPETCMYDEHKVLPLLIGLPMLLSTPIGCKQYVSEG